MLVKFLIKRSSDDINPVDVSCHTEQAMPEQIAPEIYGEFIAKSKLRFDSRGRHLIVKGIQDLITEEWKRLLVGEGRQREYLLPVPPLSAVPSKPDPGSPGSSIPPPKPPDDGGPGGAGGTGLPAPRGRTPKSPEQQQQQQPQVAQEPGAKPAPPQAAPEAKRSPPGKPYRSPEQE